MSAKKQTFEQEIARLEEIVASPWRTPWRCLRRGRS